MIVDILLAVAAVAATVVAFAERARSRKLKLDLEAAKEVVALANDPVMVADLVRGRILEANEAACELLGYERSELLTRTLPDLHPEELRARSAEVIADVYEKRGLVYKLPFRNKAGKTIDAEISAKIFRFQNQVAMLIFARDIRERMRLEAQLVQSEKMAALGQLVAGVAHEINTPIGSIHANADVSTRALEMVSMAFESEGGKAALAEDRKLVRALAILRENNDTNRVASERIVERVRALKNFARLDEAERKKADLHEGIDNTLMLLRHELKNDIELIKRYGELPDVECHPNQLNQVFMNILVNAIQAMRGMSTKATITIETKVQGDEVEVAFSDTGKGIAADDLGRIFDPGFTRKGVGVGTGLGLSISYQIIERHRGRIHVESELGKGTTFRVRLPVRFRG
jgi:PAS domain S-box-containing protein